MKTGFYSDPIFLAHDTGGHPENAGRLEAIAGRLAEEAVTEKLEFRAPRPATREEITAIHDADYVRQVEEAVLAGQSQLDSPDCILSPGTYEAALNAAGALIDAAVDVEEGRLDNAFVACRPPGHHAEQTHAMGFCYFNNVAIAAAMLTEKMGLERVLIFDFDVHHGNGTEAIFRNQPNVMVASIHQSLIFPNSGDSSDTGAGNIVNVPLARHTAAKDFRQAFESRIVPRLMEFAPELLFISAGFDAHVRDPLGDQHLMTADFAWLTELLMAVADDHCGGRLVSALEGGYNPEAVASAGAAHIGALMRH